MMEMQSEKHAVTKDKGSYEDLGNPLSIPNDLQLNMHVIAKDSTSHPFFIDSQILVKSEQVVDS